MSYKRFPSESGGGGAPTAHNDLTNRDVAGNHAKLIPLVDGTSAIQITKANGTTGILSVDTTNSRVGVNTTTPAFDVELLKSATGDLGSVLQLRNGGIENNSSNLIRMLCSGVATATQGSCEIEAFRTNLDASGDTKIVFRTTKGTTKADQLVIDSYGNIGVKVDLPKARLDVAGGVKVADDTDTASADKVGTLRYRADGNNSYCEMCMQTGAATYAWEIIKTMTW